MDATAKRVPLGNYKAKNISPHFPHTNSITNIEIFALEEINMKATGIVRRIDDLGRVVVPKEIRRTLKIREGDPMEIFTEKDGEIILRKYSPIGEMSEHAKQYADTLAHTSGHIVIITDKNSIVAVSGAGKKDAIGKAITKELYGIIENRNVYITGKGDKRPVKIWDGMDNLSGQVIAPIISEGDIMGAVIIIGKDENGIMGDVEHKLAASAASFLGKQMEI